MEKRNVTVLKCPVDILSLDEALSCTVNAVKNNQNFHVITINPEMIMNAQKNSDFFEIIKNSDLNIPDGVGVEIALKLKKVGQQRIRGIDFSRELLKSASENGFRVALVGAKEDVIQKAKENILAKYPDLNIVYSRNGYFSNDDEIINELKNTKPQILLLGLGSPAQEEFIAKAKNQLSGCAMVGVGGSFDVFSGIVKESPVIFRKLGLEWLYRTALQPERIKRIFPVLPIFLLKCIMNTDKD